MSVRSIRSVRSLPSMRRSLHSSTSAPKPSHLLSTQQDTTRSHFQSLTVPALKSECRQRGLKLAGRKVDLVDRIVGFEQAKSFSVSAQAQSSSLLVDSKPPTSPAAAAASAFSTSASAEASIDAYTIPPPPLEEGAQHPVSKIPKGPDAAGSSVNLESEKSLAGDTGASAGDVHLVDDSTRVSTMNVDLGDGAPKHDEERLGYKPSYKLPPNDKAFLWGLGGLIGAWWGSQWLGKKKDETK